MALAANIVTLSGATCRRVMDPCMVLVVGTTSLWWCDILASQTKTCDEEANCQLLF